MKATGVVRRIDDLGRIVLPKELRKTMRIKEGESLEIFTEGVDQIVLKKYSPVERLDSFVKDFTDSMYKTNKRNILITDNEKVIAASGDFNTNIIGKNISKDVEDALLRRSTQIFDKGNSFEICDGYNTTKSTIIKPINVFGDIMGCVIVEGNTKISEIEKSIAEFGGMFMARYLEV